MTYFLIGTIIGLICGVTIAAYAIRQGYKKLIAQSDGYDEDKIIE